MGKLFNIVSLKSLGLYFAKLTLDRLSVFPHKHVFIKEYGRFHVPIHSIHMFFLKHHIDVLPMRGELFIPSTDRRPALVTHS